MLTTSSNQYIKPEYLSPSPNTFDSKNSPLALLAQTCSAIGSDQPNPKLLANIEKSIKNKEPREKLSPGSNSTFSNNSSSSDTPKSSFKPYEPNFREKTRTSPDEVGVQKAKVPKVTPPIQPLASVASSVPVNGNRCESNQSATSRESPVNRKTPKESNSPNRASKESAASMVTEQGKSSPHEKEKSVTSSTVTATTTPSPYMSSFTTHGFPYAMDPMAALNAHHSLLKGPTMNPYLSSYAAAAAARMKMPECRDPYCTGCALNPHMMGGAKQCPAGCTQCDHPASAAAAAAAAAAAKSYPSLPTAAGSYAHAQLAALAAASQMPYVCNWIAGDSSYCGKRFSTSEELFQHLRTQHTTGNLGESMLNPAIAAAMASGIPPTHPLFQRNYPSMALNHLAAARYHPYNKPSLMQSSLPTSIPGFPMPPHPSLAQYFSPYSLYGPR